MFYSNEAISLEKRVNCKGEILSLKPEEIDSAYEIQKCADWIKTNGYKEVCLQFPDSLLPDSAMVALRLQSILDQRVSIMGDTAYESCCIDYLTAAHINADAIIHFGPVCFSKEVGTIPCLKIYEKGRLNIQNFEEAFVRYYNGNSKQILILLDTPYVCFKDELAARLSSNKNVSIECIDNDSLSLGKCYTISITNSIRKLHVLAQRFNDEKFFYYDPESPESSIVDYKQDLRLVKRRHFLVEKIKDSRTLGIIIGTLAVKNYLRVIERIKKLAKLHNKKYYTISVGRPTVAKLANFPEIDIYILVSCAMNELYESRDFYKPIVTPYDVEVALNPDPKCSQFSFDFNSCFPEAELENNSDLDTISNKIEINDVSLISGKIRSAAPQNENVGQPNDRREVALKNDGTIALNSHYGAGFLAEKSWKGLEQNLGQDEPALAQEGRKGVAMTYTNETN